jgi:hypothetical protein
VPQWIRGPPSKEISSLGLSLSLTRFFTRGVARHERRFEMPCAHRRRCHASSRRKHEQMGTASDATVASREKPGLTLLHVIGHVEQGWKRHRSIQSCTPQWSHFAAVGGPSSAVVPRHSSATSVPCRDFWDCILVVPDQILWVQFPSQAP